MQKNLHEILQNIYQENPDNALLMSLLQFLAPALRALHDQQFRLLNLTNQNIVIEHETLIVEKIVQTMPITLTERAEDLSKLSLPDDYWRIFKHIYFNDGAVPSEFSIIADKLQAQQTPDSNEQNIWLWDEKSGQAMVILNRASKKRYRKISSLLKQLWNVLITAIPVYLTYRQLRITAFQQKVTLTDKIGIALHTDYSETELMLLEELQNIPVLLRFGCHETEMQWQKTIALIATLAKKHIKISVALLQDRQAVINPARWHHFLNTIIPAIHDKVQWLEIGHAINRVKWGIWSATEYAQLVSISTDFKKQFPSLKLTGPAVIDFEWHRVLDALKSLPKKFRFDALSQHLYIDRRGAPENYQGKISIVDKCALLKAIASTSRHCENKVIISEVNWPLQDTGIWSPIGSPYTAPEWFRDRPGVTEEDYANYLVRYLALTLCSGFIDQVFWWRLSAHGFGLVDAQHNFRKRPAFYALKNWVEQLGNAAFIKKLPSPDHTFLLLFEKNANKLILAWSIVERHPIILPIHCQTMVNRNGSITLISEQSIMLSPSPIYCY